MIVFVSYKDKVVLTVPPVNNATKSDEDSGKIWYFDSIFPGNLMLDESMFEKIRGKQS